MTYYYLAFFMGIFGSLHCAVMCGPLLLAVQVNSKISWKGTINKLLYQIGRIMMYGCIGLAFGLLGSIAAMKGWQQGFSLFTGLLLLAFGFVQGFCKKSRRLASLQTKAIQPFAKMMGLWLYKPGGAFVAGLLNGILPCGMVYMALISAMSADGAHRSFAFMVLFGLGTLPVMLIFSLAAGFSKGFIKVKFGKLIPIIYVAMGFWFILRGANLDIPYLSPLLHIEGAMDCA